jgi:hypothetical protein
MPNLVKFVTELLGFDPNNTTNSKRQKVIDMEVNTPIINEGFMNEVKGNLFSCVRLKFV